jgi:glycosyltransferase 2 family protein
MKKWLNILYIIFLIAIVLGVIFNLKEIKKVFLIISHSNLNFIYLAMLSIILSFVVVALTNKSILNTLGHHVGFFKLFKLSIVMISINTVLPSMGLAGNTAMFHSLKSHHKIKEGKILSSMTIFYTALVVSFLIILMASLLSFILVRNLGLLDLFWFIANLLLIILIFFTIYELMKNKRHFSNFIESIINKTLGLFKKKMNKQKFYSIINEFYEGLRKIKNDKKHFLLPLLLLSLKHFFDALAIYLLFLSLGFNVSIFIIIFSIAIADILSLTMFVPGGIGVFELSIAGVLVAFGVPFNLSLAAVLLFRIFSFWIPTLIGVAIYKNTLKV